MAVDIGTRVRYEDMANPRREGEIVAEVAGQWAVRWDDPQDHTVTMEDGVEFHTTVTKAMLQHAVERQMRRTDSVQIAGWGVLPRRYLDFRFDVTGLTPDEIGELALEVVVQSEPSDGHRVVPVPESDTVEIYPYEDD